MSTLRPTPTEPPSIPPDPIPPEPPASDNPPPPEITDPVPSPPESDAPPTIPPDPIPPEPEGDSDVLAFRKGVEAHSPKQEADPADASDEPEEAAEDGTKPPAPAEPTGPRDPVADEMAELRLGERAQARFRELSARAKEADRWEQVLSSTQAPPESMVQAVNYLSDIHSGDPARMARAFDTLTAELDALGRVLGRATPSHDPIMAHPDLVQRLERGEDEALLREVAAARASSHLQQATQAQVQNQQQAVLQANEQGLEQVRRLGERLRAADPVGFAARFAALQPQVDAIQSQLPPADWAPAIAALWASTPPAHAAPAPVPARPSVSRIPLRAASQPGQRVAAMPDDPAAAFRMGADRARQAAAGAGWDEY